jgi:hypothetical protein
MSTEVLSPVIAEHIAAVNAFDLDRVVATFAHDALVNDDHREFRGIAAIRAWVAKEMVGDHVTIDVVQTRRQQGITVVDGRYDGDYDKTNLPAELILTSYFSVDDGKISSLIIVHNRPALY